MKVASLCSGYGGLELGVALVETVDVIWHAEFDTNAAFVHEQHWPGIPNLGDIKAIDWACLETPHLLTAGYPCQPFSQAGQRKGSDDPRHLWPFVAEAVRVLRPHRVLLENVAGHLSLGFGTVLGDLAEAGYDARWMCVRASDVGAPHRRERVFVVAADTRSERHGREQDGRVVGRLDRAHEREDGERQRAREVAQYRGGEARPAPDSHGVVGSTPCARDRGRATLEGPGAVAGTERLHRVAWGEYRPAIERWERLTRPAPVPSIDGQLNPELPEWMMGLPAGWVTGHGLPRTAELKMLGNGVVPQAAAVAWKELTC